MLGIVFLLVNLHRLSTAVLSGELTVDFSITAAQLGTLHASFFVIYAIVQIPTGVLVDRYGPRYIGAAGTFVLSAGAIGFMLSGGYLSAFFSRAIIGLGSGVIFVSVLRFCANWYRTDEFAMMTGMTAGIGGLGAIFATTPLAISVEWFGWRSTLAALGLVGFVSGVLIFAFVRRSPAAAGLDPIDDVPEQPSVTFSEIGGYLRELATDPDQWLLSLVFFSAMGTVLTIIGLWGVPYLVVVYDLSVTTASYYTLFGSVGMLLGSPAIGWISDRVGNRIVPLIVGLCLFAITISIIPVFGDPPLAAIAVAYFVVGASVGTAMLALSIIKEKYPAGASGVATATVNGAGFFGGTILPAAMGLVLDQYRTGDVVAGTAVYTELGYRIAFGITALAVITAVFGAIGLYIRENRIAKS